MLSCVCAARDAAPRVRCWAVAPPRVAVTTRCTQVVDAVNALEGRRQKLSELQAAVGLGAWNETLLVDLRLAGIVEAWAAGLMWKQVRGRAGGARHDAAGRSMGWGCAGCAGGEGWCGAGNPVRHAGVSE